MKKGKRLISLAICVVLVLGMLSAVSVSVSASDPLDNRDVYDAIVEKIDYEDLTEEQLEATPAEGTLYSAANDAAKAELPFTYKSEDNNNFWNATRTDTQGNRNNAGVYYPNSAGNYSSYSADKSSELVFDKTGQYIIQAKIRMTAGDVTTDSHGLSFDAQVDGTWKKYQITSVTFNESSSQFAFGDAKDETIYFAGEEVGTISTKQEWYTFRIYYNLDTEKDELTSYMEIDGADGNNVVTTTPKTIACTKNVRFYRICTELWKNAGSGIDIDDFMIVKPAEKAPEIKGDVTIDGVARVGQTLTANAVVTDVNAADVVSADYQWQYFDGTDWQDITTAIEKTYIVEDDYLGQQLRVKVTPRSSNAPDPGAPKFSAATSDVEDFIAAPTASHVIIDGDFEVNKELVASFNYSSAAGNEKGDHIYIWETDDEENGDFENAVQTSTSYRYTVRLADAGKYLRVRVIPKDITGLAGEPTPSEATLVTVPGTVEFFVSTTGNDSNEGTKDAPFATIEKARDTIRGMNLPSNGVIVNIMGGTYPVSNTIEFTAEDSGTKDAPIIYQAYDGQKVSFIGGKTLDLSKAEKVTDENILGDLVEEKAKDHLYMLDLGEQGVEMNALGSYGFGSTSYKTMRIYMNNTALTEARWPNDDQSSNVVKCRPLTNVKDGIDESKYNTDGKPIKFEYPDPENRSAKWKIKSGDAYVGGAIVFFWASANLLIDNIDVENKIVTSLSDSPYASAGPNVGWGPQHKVFFSNIFAEIDVPGESYVDRENDILYFYPVGDVEGGNMVVSTLKENMITVTDASNLTFKGIDFKDTRDTPVVLSGCDNVRIENSEISNTSHAGVEMKNCTNSVITGCHIYNTAISAVVVNGGDRENLTPSGNEIYNNNFHSFAQLPMTKVNRVGVQLVGCVGEKIHHNEFSDFDFGAIVMDESNDILIEYNRILNGEQFGTDAGAIYWGREFAALGFVIRYNYFENIASENICLRMGGGGAYSAFWDDAATGPDMYGNVFYNGGVKAGQIVSNGGEFSNIHGNVLIATEDDKLMNGAAYQRLENGIRIKTWGNNENTPGIKADIPISAYTYLMNFRDLLGGSIVVSKNATDAKKKEFQDNIERMWSAKWADRYADTQWAKAIELYNKEDYEAIKALHAAGNKQGMIDYINENLPAERTSSIHSNVVLGRTTILDETLVDVYENYKGTEGKITAEDKALFADFDNKDFTITDEGLEKIKQTAPEFEAIPFSEIGLLSEVGGHKPSVTIDSGIVSGYPAAGNEITASYTYSDADGDAEGNTVVYWYVSDKENGPYEMVWGKQGKFFEISDDYSGRYLKYEVVPYDTDVLRGETVMSAPIAVKNATSINMTALSGAVADANALLENAVIGDGAGEYPESAKADLVEAIAMAQQILLSDDVTQYQVNKAAEELEAAILTFKSRQNNVADSYDITIERISVNELLKDTENWNTVEGVHEFKDGSLVIGDGNVHSWVTYTGKKFKNTEFSFKYKAELTGESAPEAWGGIYLRQSSTDGIVWSGGNTGSMIDMKQDKLLLQEYPGVKTYETLDTFKLEMGKEYDMSVGIYDLNNDEKVVLIFTVDGETVYAKVLESEQLYNLDGYLGFNADQAVVTISPVYADIDLLEQKITEAKAFIANNTTGDFYGQYPEDKKTAIEAALDKAEVLTTDSVQYDVDKVLAELNKALLDAKNSISNTGEITGNGSVEINSDIPEAKITVDKDVKDLTIDIDPQTGTPEIKVTSNDTELTVSQGTLISNDFKMPLKSNNAPSGTFRLGTAVNTYAQGGSKAEADKPVRIVLKGQKGMNVAYKDDSKYVNITRTLREDSFDAAEDALAGNTVPVKMVSGDDLVIYTTLLTELVTYEKAAASDDDDDDYVSNNNNNYGGAPAGGGGGAGGFFSTTTTTPSANASNTFVFSDMASHWAKSDVMSMYNAGIVSGVTANTFEPDRPITRAEFATLIAKGLKLTLEITNDFTDVKADDWFAPYVGAAANAGIIVGADGKFRPNDTITREEMAVIIVKAYTYLGGKGANGSIDNFSDKAQISDWAKAYVDSAASAGLIAGLGDGTFGPKANATRAQSASLVYRVIK